MKIRAAVLNAMGAALPYAKSKPLTIETIELKPPGPGEILVKIGAAVRYKPEDISAWLQSRPTGGGQTS